MGLMKSMLVAVVIGLIFFSLVIGLVFISSNGIGGLEGLEDISSTFRSIPQDIFGFARDLVSDPGSVLEEDPTNGLKSPENLSTTNITIRKVFRVESLNELSSDQVSDTSFNETTTSNMSLDDLNEILPFQEDRKIVTIVNGSEELQQFVTTSEQSNSLERGVFKIHYDSNMTRDDLLIVWEVEKISDLG